MDDRPLIKMGDAALSKCVHRAQPIRSGTINEGIVTSPMQESGVAFVTKPALVSQ